MKNVKEFFAQGHPEVSLFGGNHDDVHAILLHQVEIAYGDDIYDQNGGEFTNETELPNGEHRGDYTLYDIELSEDSGPRDILFELTGVLVGNTFHVHTLKFEL